MREKWRIRLVLRPSNRLEKNFLFFREKKLMVKEIKVETIFMDSPLSAWKTIFYSWNTVWISFHMGPIQKKRLTRSESLFCSAPSFPLRQIEAGTFFFDGHLRRESRALSFYLAFATFFVFLARDPHLLESTDRCQDRPSDPCAESSLRTTVRAYQFEPHARWYSHWQISV